jgi:hypothetical protein
MLRLHYLDRAVIGNNDLGPGTGADGHVLYIPGPEYTNYPPDKPSVGLGQFARRILVSDNVLRAGKHLNWTLYVGSQNTGQDERFRDVLVERNLFLPGSNHLQASVTLRGYVERATVRDNVMIQKSDGQCVVLGPWVHRTLPSPRFLPSDVTILHNSCILGGGPLVYMDKRDSMDFTRVYAHNNLVMSPEPVLTQGGGRLARESGNLLVKTPAQAGVIAADVSDWKGMGLAEGSSALDRADPRVFSPWDFTGKSRYADKAPDIGALER